MTRSATSSASSPGSHSATAWEHYPFNGYYFLKALYAQLSSHPQLQLMTLSECLGRGLTPAPLPRVLAGSWVHGTLATWMGDAAKNRAWDLLCDAKLAYDRAMQTLSDAGMRAQAGRQLALCESSDWFWWFGDYNPADAVAQFDSLYRRQLVTLYRRLNLVPPGELALPISVGSGAPEHGGVMRRASAL
jgi:alpha-amylase/alpha-mannosidase (GH57 family)